MKKKNCISEFSSERSELLLRNFRESLARQSKISLQKAFEDAVDAPAPRFWVSEARAMRVVSFLMRGEDITQGMLPEKREMYLEIYRRAKEIKETRPWLPLGDIVFEIVNQPAPRSYLRWQTVQKIVNRVRQAKTNQ